MAEKHKSKYKAPKDFEKSLKTPTRKDLKDYTHDDKDGGMNPYSTKEMQDLVLRKVDKEVIDNIQNMVPEIKHRVYQDVKTGKYSQKEAKKIFKKLQLKDSESYLEPAQSIEEGVIAMSLQEHIDSLNQNQKNAVLRKYIRIKLVEAIKKRYLTEQLTTPTTNTTSDTASGTDQEEEQTVETPPATDTAATPPAATPPPATDTTATPPPATDTTATPPPATAKQSNSETEIEKPEEQSPEEQAAQQLAKRKQVSKDFYAVVQASKSSDTLDKFISTALQPLIASITGVSDEKFQMMRYAAIRKLKAASNISKKIKKK